MKLRKITHHYGPSIFLLLLCSCGIVKVGESTTNEPIPAGTVIAQASITAQNGKTVSGTASVYQLNSNGTYIVRLENLVSPVETNVQIRVKVNGQITETYSLRSPTGNQNYPSTQSGTGTWNSVDIYSVNNSLVYGIALF